MTCPLCLSEKNILFHKDSNRNFFQCSVCKLTFVDPQNLPDLDSERNRYLLHENSPEDQGYVRFLRSFVDPFSLRLQTGQCGLDFGSGPTPVLAELFRSMGYTVALYDPFFCDNKEALTGFYDFLYCVETAEHFHHPLKEWKLMTCLVKEGGWIGVMTEMLTDEIDFESWHYKSDFTHVCFYSKQTFDWIGRKFGLTPEFEGSNRVFFRVGN